jgi:hypothetical protein
MRASASATLSRLVNLVVPGGGLILIGSAASGVLLAALFTVTAAFAIVSNLLFPDDFASAWRGLGIGVALGTWLGAQLRLAQSVRRQRERAAGKLREATLRDVRAELLAGRFDDAWRAIQPMIHRADDDLALACRLAQVLTARESPVAARAAWRRVRRLDRHRIYRQEVEEGEWTLSQLEASASGSNSAESPQA